MAWIRCGTLSYTEKNENNQSSKTYYGDPQPVRPAPSIGSRTVPDRLFSHPIVPLGSKNYLGQYFMEADINGQPTNVITNSSLKQYCTFEPALGSIFNKEGIVTVKATFNYTTYINGVPNHIYKEATQDILVVNHGIVVQPAETNIPFDIYSDGYCFIRPTDVNSYIFYNSGSNYNVCYNIRSYDNTQTIKIKKVSCLPWYVYSIGGPRQTTIMESGNPIPQPFLFGDGVTSIDISELAWASLYWCTSMNQLFYYVGNVIGLEALSYWNVFGIRNFYCTFKDCGFSSALFASIISNWDLSGTAEIIYMFYHCTGITNVNFLSTWNIYYAVTLAGMFKECVNLNDISGLANWDIMGPCLPQMFENCTSLTSVQALANWGNNYHPGSSEIDGRSDESRTHLLQYGFSRMFKGCTNLLSLNGLQNLFKDVPTIAGSEYVNFTWYYFTDRMFAECSSLIDISALDTWKTQVKKMRGAGYASYQINSGNSYSISQYGCYKMFAHCYSLKNLIPLKDWDISSWTDIDGIFEGCIALDNVTPLKNWDVSSCKYINYLFNQCINLTSTNLSTIMDDWGDKLTNLICSCYNFAGCLITSLNIFTHWNPIFAPGVPVEDWSSTVLNGNDYGLCAFFDGMRLKDTNFNGVSHFDVSKVKNFTDFLYNINRCAAYTDGSHTLLGYWWGSIESRSHSYFDYKEKSTDNYWIRRELRPYYYNRCIPTTVEDDETTIITLDGLEYWDAHPKYLNQAFAGHKGFHQTTYPEYYTPGIQISDIDGISNWDVSNVETLNNTFYYNRITDLTPLTNWSLSSVTKMQSSFANNFYLTSLDGLENLLSNNNICTAISSIFYNNWRLTDISALASWDVSNITDFSNAFDRNFLLHDCSPLANWDTSSAKNFTYMFNYCTGIFDASFTSNWDFSHITIREDVHHELDSGIQYMFETHGVPGYSALYPDAIIMVSAINPSGTRYSVDIIQDNSTTITSLDVSDVTLVYGNAVKDGSASNNWNIPTLPSTIQTVRVFSPLTHNISTSTRLGYWDSTTLPSWHSRID